MTKKAVLLGGLCSPIYLLFAGATSGTTYTSPLSGHHILILSSINQQEHGFASRPRPLDVPFCR